MDFISLLLVLASLWLAFGGGGIPWPIGSPPPFKTDKLAVLVLHDATDQTNLPQWVNATAPGSLQSWTAANGGEFWIADKTSDGKFRDQKWQDALKCHKPTDPVPWIVAANPKTGINQAITSQAETLKALAPLGAN